MGLIIQTSVTGYELVSEGLDPRTSVFTTTSKPTQWPAQSPVAGRGADHEPPSNAEVNKSCSFTSTPSVCTHRVVLVHCNDWLVASRMYITSLGGGLLDCPVNRTYRCLKCSARQNPTFYTFVVTEQV